MASRLVLVIGDLFIPDRAPDIPAKFRKLLTPGKISTVLSTGNLTSVETYAFLRSLAPDLHQVRGDFDIDPPPSFQNSNVPTQTPAPAPLSKVITHGSLRIGLTQGHTIIPRGDADALLMAARQMDCDVLVYGGGRGFEAYELEGKFFICPGSGTGAFNTEWVIGEDANAAEVDPSFCLMDIQGEVLVLYVYQLRTDASGSENVAVEKVSFRKPSAVTAVA